MKCQYKFGGESGVRPGPPYRLNEASTFQISAKRCVSMAPATVFRLRRQQLYAPASLLLSWSLQLSRDGFRTACLPSGISNKQRALASSEHPAGGEHAAGAYPVGLALLAVGNGSARAAFPCADYAEWQTLFLRFVLCGSL